MALIVVFFFESPSRGFSVEEEKAMSTTVPIVQGVLENPKPALASGSGEPVERAVAGEAPGGGRWTILVRRRCLLPVVPLFQLGALSMGLGYPSSAGSPARRENQSLPLPPPGLTAAEPLHRRASSWCGRVNLGGPQEGAESAVVGTSSPQPGGAAPGSPTDAGGCRRSYGLPSGTGESQDPGHSSHEEGSRFLHEISEGPEVEMVAGSASTLPEVG